MSVRCMELPLIDMETIWMQNYIIKFYLVSWTVSEGRYIQEDQIIIKIALFPTCLRWKKSAIPAIGRE